MAVLSEKINAGMIKLSVRAGNIKLKKVYAVLLAAGLFVTLSLGVFAENEIAQTAGKWVLDGLFWVFVVGTVIACGKAAINRNFVAALVIFIVGGLICVVCKNPDIISQMGEKFKSAFGI